MKELQDLTTHHQALRNVAAKQFNAGKWAATVHTLCELLEVEGAHKTLSSVVEQQNAVSPVPPPESPAPVPQEEPKK